MLRLDGSVFSDYLGVFSPLVLKGPKPITVRLKFNISERLNDDNLTVKQKRKKNEQL